MTQLSKPKKTFTRNNFAEHNYNYTHPPRPHYSPGKFNNNHVYSHNWNRPTTTNNPENFQSNQHHPQDHSKNYPFFQQNKNRQKKSHHTDYVSSDDDRLPDIFETYLQEYRTQKPPRPQYKRIFLENPLDFQGQQPQVATSYNTQFFQPVQTQNPMTKHSYQPNQMHNEIPLPYYLQQHEITKNQLTNFSQIPNAAESLQMTMNPYLMRGSSIT